MDNKPVHTAQPVQQEKVAPTLPNNRTAFKCHSCNFKTSTLRHSKAKKRLASHIHGGHCTTDIREECFI